MVRTRATDFSPLTAIGSSGPGTTNAKPRLDAWQRGSRACFDNQDILGEVLKRCDLSPTDVGRGDWAAARLVNRAFRRVANTWPVVNAMLGDTSRRQEPGAYALQHFRTKKHVASTTSLSLRLRDAGWKQYAAWTVAFTADSTRILTAGCDNVARLWTVPRQPDELLSEFQDPEVVYRGGLTCALPAPKGQHAAVGLWDGGIDLVDLTAPLLHKRLGTHDDYITSLTFLSDSLLISGAVDGVARLWDKRQAEAALKIDAGRAIRCAATASDQFHVALACDHPTLQLWDLRQTSRKPMSLVGHGRAANSVTFVNGPSYLASVSDDATVRAFNCAGAVPQTSVIDKGACAFNAIKVSANHVWLAYASSDARMHLRDYGQSRPSTIHLDAHECEPSPPPWHGELAFSPDGLWLAGMFYYYRVHLWDMSGGERLV